MRALKDGAVSLLEDLLSWVSSLPRRILDALGDMGRLLWDAGRALIQGLIGGIRDKLGDLRETLSGIKNAIISWKGPLSDDRELLVPAGQAVMEGFVVGITSMMPDVRETLQDVSSTIIAETAALRDAVNSATFDIAEALRHLRNHFIITERSVESTMSRIRQVVIESISGLVSALTESGSQTSGLADAVSAAVSRVVEIINRGVFWVANALSELRPHLWITAQAFNSMVSKINEALTDLVTAINRNVFWIANALGELRPHLWMTTRAFQSMASHISEVMSDLVGVINRAVFSISDALSQLRAQLSITASAFKSLLPGSRASYAAPQPDIGAVAARPAMGTAISTASTAPVINIIVQERDVAGEVERALRRVLFQAGW
jgi:hypothetical protein